MKTKANDAKGITLVALVVTIIVILILASVVTYNGIEAIDTARLNRFISEMKIMQIQVNDFYDKYKNGEEVGGYTGEEIINNIGLSPVQSQGKADKVFQENTSGITDRSGYRYFNTETINKLGIENVQEEFFINISKRSIISANGFEYNGNTYYTMEQIPNNLYNVDYKENTQPLDFNVKSDLIGENKYKITIEPIYSGNIQKWEVKYQLDGDAAYWNTSDELTFNVEKVGRYNIKIQNGDIESEIKKEYIGYVAEGMLLHYDGIINTRNGSNKSAEINTWEDLSGNRNDGTLNGCTWEENNLSFDGVDYWVSLDNIIDGNQNITIEYVINQKRLKNWEYLWGIKANYFGLESGASRYRNLYYNNTTNSEDAGVLYNVSVIMGELNKIVANSIVLSAQKINAYNNSNKLITNQNLDRTLYTDGSVFGIGSDGKGEYNTLMDCYTFRIYNRALTDEEVKRNYEIDKTRFNIQ